MADIVVIGAANMDVGAVSAVPLAVGDSNPGTVHLSPGGVGRNIAHNLCLLGVDTALVTALGNDGFAAALRQNAAEIGLDLSHSLTVPGAATSTYVYVAGPDGDMTAAVNDMAIYEAVTPRALEPRLDFINSARLVVLDANLPEESLAWLGEHCTAPIVADPVSAVKGRRLRGVLDRLYALKPNRLEAEMLTGVHIRTAEDAFRAAQILLDKGVQRVYISLSADGLTAAERGGEAMRVACPRAEVADATGGGDAMAAALAASLLRGDTLQQSARWAVGAGALACTAPGAICPDMSWENIEKIMRK